MKGLWHGPPHGPSRGGVIVSAPSISTTHSSRGPLSWQQWGRLRRDRERSERQPNCTAVFPVSDDLSLSDLRERLCRLVEEEESLRIVELTEDGDGYATYAGAIEPPLHSKTAGSLEELDAIVTEMSIRPFARSGGPLWDIAVIEHRDVSGKTIRTACAAFDHIISDGRSVHLFRQAIRGEGQGTDGQRGRYSDWVAWQRETYPLATNERSTPARDFWRRYLGETAPDRATMLPFCTDPTGPPSGVIETIFRRLPTSPAQLRAASRQRRASPFVVFLGSVAATIGYVAETDDMTVRVNMPGRPPGFLDTLGWFSDCLPVRIRHGSLHDPADALKATTSAWLETLAFQTTPWDFVRAVCAGSEMPSTLERPPQVIVNFLPFERVQVGTENGTNTRPGMLATLQLIVVGGDRDELHLACQFDPDRFATPGVHAFLTLLSDRLIELCR
jgi:Condensation domain